MVADHAARHEMIDARVWDGGMRAWWPLAPWEELTVEGRADWTVTKASITVGDDHPQAARLRSARHQPVPVSFEVNGVRWDGYVDDVETGQREDGTRYVVARMSSEAKHFHRMLARGPVVSAADDTAREVSASLGEVTRELVSEGAVRTGLPTYVVIDDEGDRIELEVRTEDYVADVLADPLGGSSSFVEVRKLMPGDPLPGVSRVEHYSGALERRWEAEQLASGAWPHAQTHDRLTGKAVATAVHMPRSSWRGTGDRDIEGKPQDPATAPVGVCWVPFDIEPQLSAGYYTDPGQGRHGVFSAPTSTIDSYAQQYYPGRPHHVTLFMPGTLTPNAAPKLSSTAASGLLTTPTGQNLNSWADVNRYVDGGWAFAWHAGGGWVLANQADFDADQRQYEPRGRAQKQTPGVLVWQHAGRDRRGVVFSSSPGGGLSAWSTTETGADGAMIIAGGQLDQQTISRLQSLGQRPLGVTGELEPGQISAYTGDASMIERVDVDAQPAATIEGTDVSYSSIGGRVNIRSAGPFFLREKYMNLSSSGVNPVSEIGREWAQTQGSTSIKLTPGHHQTVVFGDDVRAEDGRIIPGWKPGDRVSFVDGDTRVSEVIMGYELRDTPSTPFTATPILGRQVNGVLADLGRRLRAAERTSTKAYLQPPRRLGQPELIDTVEKSPIGAGVHRLEKNLGKVRDLLYEELGAVSADLAVLRRDMEDGLDDGGRLLGSMADAVGRVSAGTQWAGLEGDDLAQAIVFTLQAQDTLNKENLAFDGLVRDQLALQALVNKKQGEWNKNTEDVLKLFEENDRLQHELWVEQQRINQQQREINDQNEEFRRLTEQLDAQQTEQIEQITSIQKQLVEESSGRIRELMATPAGTSDPSVKSTSRDDGKPGWQVKLPDIAAGGFFHVQWYKGKSITDSGAVFLEPDSQLMRSMDKDFSYYILVSSPDSKYLFARWVTMTKRQVTVNKSGGDWGLSRGLWTTVMTYPAPNKTARQVSLRLKVTWEAATHDDRYGIRIRAGDRTLREHTTSGLGPLTFLGDGVRWMSSTVSDRTIQPGETISVDVYSTATLSGGRRVKSAELTGTWIEEV